MSINWRLAAAGFLENHHKTSMLMSPPAILCMVRWHGITKVGAVQWPVRREPEYSAVVFLSITSKYVEPEFIKALKNIKPDWLMLQADASVDLTENFSILHRVGLRLTGLTPEEQVAMQPWFDGGIVQITPTDEGIHFDGIISFKKKDR